MNDNNPKAPLTPLNYEPNRHPDYQDDEIDLRELFGIIWQGKWWIIAITFVFAVGSVIYSLSLPNIYKSEATLAPTEEASGGGLSQMAGQLGGLASLAGVNLGAKPVDKTTIAIEILQSRAFIKSFVEKYNILPELMAVEEWNRQNGLVYNKEIYDPATNEWLREVEPPQEPQPSSWEYAQVFKSNVLSVTRDLEKGLVTLSVNHQSPEVAEQWTTWLISEINNHMRERDIQEARRSLEYLNEELQETALSNMQQVFYQLIEKQTQTIMLANVRPEYIFQVLDPPVVPEQKAKPSRALICIIGTFLGGFLGVGFVLVRNIFRKEENAA
ncbi:lipopolysaccharide biosynthesis protein [Idiomarina sp. WRN-38]|uniref:Wzz/FepE/Etk N-terminal domain-containing protein n=1 Tax=Idiomarina sp. OXR-189 TaxID=3100175 RepID=UPI000733918B|nr:Wzz/FepE/Etk N-terminal domain-containing protein [Idiomarina sp. OXR-189]KTG29867.1 lipopolysaccharide biosynthesis protein [Idiomarina sp. H105]OAF13258.1 lipopolysaccharide biosynthesis protein [Idiomarina sp. WRN-38]WPZ00836.1 Wzz/FepE/Etk N-terminal domain-containing protein [Idiomarina sp. OXR-189]